MTDLEILQKNLVQGEKLRSQADAIVLGQLDELARIVSLSHSCLSPEGAAAAYSKAFPDSQLLSDDFAVFLQLLWKQNLLEPVPIFDVAESPKTSLLYYVPNSYTETAREKFSPLLPTAVPCPGADFQSICEAAVSEDNSFCILPISSSAEGELPAFSRMIHEYQLKTRAVCDVTTSDGESELRLALLGGQIYWTRDTSFVEISLVPESDTQLIAALSAFKKIGGSLYRINARPMEYNMNKFYYKITVNVSPETIHCIAAFIKAAIPTGANGAFHIL